MLMYSDFYVFDIESNNWIEIYSLNYFDGSNVVIDKEVRKNNDAYIKHFLDNAPEGTYYAHNGGNYDFLFVVDFCMNNRITISNMVIIHGRIGIFKIVYGIKEFIFKDSYLILPHSLKSLTVSFDVPHKKLELDYDIGIKDKRFDSYITNDIMGLVEVLNASGLTEKLTIGSNSMHEFLNNFYLKKYSKISNNVHKYDKFFRLSYYGGRVELFKPYGIDINHYDINSLYPYVMHEYEYPLIEKNNFELVEHYYKNKLGIYYCNITIPKDTQIPLLPYRMNKLIFPTGKFNGVYTSAEIEKSLKLGYKIKVNSGAVFHDTDYIFKDFIEKYYDIKKNSIGAKRYIAKLFLNSLYGKFGQHSRIKEYRLVRLEDIKDSKAHKYTNGYALISSDKFRNRDFIHSEIASFITSYARLTLYSYIEKCGFDNVYYCDTDSVFTSKTLNTSEDLGAMKLESEIKEFIGIGSKLYAYKNKKDSVIIAAKGFNVNQLSYDSFKNALNGQISSINSNTNTVQRFKNAFMKHGKMACTTNITRILKSKYDKRVINGNSTVPIYLS